MLEHTHQRRDERLSEYTTWVDRILHQIMLKKGIDPKDVDKTRPEQGLQGARPESPPCTEIST